jgi:hypothetical protein
MQRVSFLATATGATYQHKESMSQHATYQHDVDASEEISFILDGCNKHASFAAVQMRRSGLGRWSSSASHKVCHHLTQLLRQLLMLMNALHASVTAGMSADDELVCWEHTAYDLIQASHF